MATPPSGIVTVNLNPASAGSGTHTSLSTPSAVIERVAKELALPLRGVSAAVGLLDGGATIPFIARYRKEATGSLDETQIQAVQDRRAYVIELEERRTAILKSIEEQGKLTETLRASILQAPTKQELEDLYLPYKPKRRTRAQIARERGLGPLAEALLAGTVTDLEATLQAYVNPEKEIKDATAAATGAKDIIAETVAHEPQARKTVREAMWKRGKLKVESGDADADKEGKFRDLHNYAEPAAMIPGHRVLAANRGEKQKALRVCVELDLTPELENLKQRYVKQPTTPAGHLVAEAVMDGCERLMIPAVEAEVRVELTDRAEAEAIEVFADNLKHLLLEPPLGAKAVLGVDPGFRTGCKLAAVAASGQFVEHATIYPHPPEIKLEVATATVLKLLEKHDIHYVAIGNGTASRETEAFFRQIAAKGSRRFQVLVVSESGASIYSASEVARREFPDLDLTVRGAISIARRLQDPLAELVKLDPKSIGVGQYQHDVNQKNLKAALDRVVESCVNGVGVEVNTASEQLLQYVSGIGPKLAQNIVAHRAANGPFANRQQLRDVPGLGPKAFEQCAGFLRVSSSANLLDRTAVHPERYGVVEIICKALHVGVAQLAGNKALLDKIQPRQFVNEAEGVGLPTLTDILNELKKPGRDPRGEFTAFAFADVHDLKDLKPGTVVPGIVTNVTKFGAFVDVGVHTDGLIHISQLADRFVKDPAEVVKVGQKLKVKVLEVDQTRKRIGLALKGVPQS